MPTTVLSRPLASKHWLFLNDNRLSYDRQSTSTSLRRFISGTAAAAPLGAQPLCEVRRSLPCDGIISRWVLMVRKCVRMSLARSDRSWLGRQRSLAVSSSSFIWTRRCLSAVPRCCCHRRRRRCRSNVRCCVQLGASYRLRKQNYHCRFENRRSGDDTHRDAVIFPRQGLDQRHAQSIGRIHWSVLAECSSSRDQDAGSCECINFCSHPTSTGESTAADLSFREWELPVGEDPDEWREVLPSLM